MVTSQGVPRWCELSCCQDRSPFFRDGPQQSGSGVCYRGLPVLQHPAEGSCHWLRAAFLWARSPVGTSGAGAPPPLKLVCVLCSHPTGRLGCVGQAACPVQVRPTSGGGPCSKLHFPMSCTPPHGVRAGLALSQTLPRKAMAPAPPPCASVLLNVLGRGRGGETLRRRLPRGVPARSAEALVPASRTGSRRSWRSWSGSGSGRRSCAGASRSRETASCGAARRSWRSCKKSI